jgi:hypothetical protein
MIRFMSTACFVALCALTLTSAAFAASSPRSHSGPILTRTDLLLLVGGGALFILIGLTIRQLLRAVAPSSAGVVVRARRALHADMLPLDDGDAVRDA